MGEQKVLIYAKAFPPDVGGVQTYSEYAARAYLKAGLTPVVISSFAGPRGWLERHYPEGDLRLYNVGTGSQALIFLCMFLAAGDLMHRERFAFVHSTTWRPSVAIIPWLGDIPLVLTVHGREVFNTGSVLGGLMKTAFRRASVVVAVSRPTLKAAQTALPTSSKVGRWLWVHNGLSYADAAKAYVRPARAPGPVRIYSFCRLVERKNLHRALEAMRKLIEMGVTNFEYVVAGDGPMRAQLEGLAIDLGLGGKVRFIGYN